MRFPERRQHVRIVTLRNFGWLTLALMVAFAAISIRSELRGRHMHDYGRLVDHQLERVQVERKPLEVVEETGPAEPARPAQDMVVVPVDQPQPLVPAAMTPQVVAPVGSVDGKVTIVGGPEGVSIVRQPRRRPQLSGGFGR